MAKQEECSKCKRAKQGGYAGEIKCSFYGRKPQFDDSPCPSFSNKNVKCPECGQEVPPSEKVCPNCGCPLEQNKPNRNNSYSESNSSTSTHSAKKTSYVPLIVVVVIVAILLCGVGIYKFIRKQEEKREWRESIELNSMRMKQRLKTDEFNRRMLRDYVNSTKIRY